MGAHILTEIFTLGVSRLYLQEARLRIVVSTSLMGWRLAMSHAQEGVVLDVHRVTPLELSDQGFFGRGRDGHPVALWAHDALIGVPLVLRGQQNSRMHRALAELSIDLQHDGADGRDVWARR